MNGEQLVPFHLCVQPSAVQICSSSQISSFPQFGKLPAELQLRILALCSAPTLFQAMRVSSTLRIEASKIFWAAPDTYFYTEDWRLLEGGSHPDHICHDLPFLAHVQNVEVEYHDGADNKIGPLRKFVPGEPRIMDIRHDLVRDFWKSLKKRFPNVKRVVINKHWESPPHRKDTKPVLWCLEILVRSCPPEIEASAFILEEKSLLIDASTTTPRLKKWQRPLYQPTADGGWEKVSSDWNRKTILMPMKRFQGLVGEFERLM